MLLCISQYKNYRYPCFVFLFQTNPSPSEETNHTDSLSTSYDTSADPQSFNATTPGQGGLLDDLHLHVSINTNTCLCISTHASVTLRKCNTSVSSGEDVWGGWGHSGPGWRAVTEHQRSASRLGLRRELHPGVAGATSGSYVQSGPQPQRRLLPTAAGLSRPQLSAQVNVTDRDKRPGNNMDYCFTGTFISRQVDWQWDHTSVKLQI